MAETKALQWDLEGERYYETGVKQVALFPYDASKKAYGNGVAWNGVTAITETPEGAEVTKIYANDTVYGNLQSAEEFGGSIEAYTYPDEFAECDGSKSPIKGMKVGQQPRKKFGLVAKTTIGNDTEGTAAGYLLHFIYGCLASPSERAYNTINDSPEAITFSWDFDTTPVKVDSITVDGATVSFNPTSIVTIDSREVDADKLAALEAVCYGNETTEAKLPMPNEIYAILAGTNA